MLFVCVNGNLLVSDIYLIFSRLLSSIRSHMKFRIAQHFYFSFLNRRFILGISKLCPLSLYQWKGQSLNIDSLDYFKEAFWYVMYSTPWVTKLRPIQNKLLCWEIGWCGLSWLAWIFKSNFHCLIRPYLEKLFSKSLMKLGDRLMTSKSERQRTSGPQKGQSLILFTVRDVTDRAHASSICPSVKILLQML